MKTMRGESGLIGGLLGLALLAMAGTTQASLVQDLTVTDPFDPGPFPGPGFTGIGQISFDTRSGDDPLSVVDFSFTPSSSFVVGPLPTFTEDDIVSVSWAVDES